MARQKQIAVQRTPSDLLLVSNGKSHHDITSNGSAKSTSSESQSSKKESAASPSKSGLGTLIFCIAGIYASFLTWAILQERITTTTYGRLQERFKFPVFLNTVQSTLAAVSGFAYLCAATSHPHRPGRPAPIFPTSTILPPLLLVSLTSSLASPFGYAALQYVDYVTFILAKSCKLLPVMFLHLTVFRKSYPLYKYAVVGAVTLGVAIFTVHHPGEKSKAAKHAAKTVNQAAGSLGITPSQAWGLFLLGINLLFDGLFNSTQDYIFQKFRPYSGPQMMCAQNILNTVITTIYLVATPYLSGTTFGGLISLPQDATKSELFEAISFVRRNPSVGYDILLFSACGAVGQVFIFHTLANFESLVLVTVNVTRKMVSMVLSVLWFGHTISGWQWVGVGLVFGGVAGEAVGGRLEKTKRLKKGEKHASRAEKKTQ